MSTPAGRWSRRWSESTVLGVGWWMSIRRLWVRISKCSCESLSLNGERMTAYTFFSVGRGTGPDTVAPVRVAVSTISLAAVSMAEWSYAFRRMRILFWVAAAIRCQSSVLSSVGGKLRTGFLRAKGGPQVLRGPPHPPLSGSGGGTAGRIGLLLDDLGHDARADRAAALANREAQTLVHGDRLDELDLHLDVVARHDHLRALGQTGDARHVRGAEVELRAVAREERRVAAALLLLEDVDLGLELRVRRYRAGLAQDLAALDLLALRAAQEAADVVSRLALVEDLAEHLDSGHDGGRCVLDPDDLHGVARVD